MLNARTDSGRASVPRLLSFRSMTAFGALPLWCALMISAPAAAELGGRHATLEADRAHLAAALDSTTAATHVLHRLTTSNGSVVREYMNADGVIFAVAWRGPGRPDLRQLLGGAFDAFQAKVTAPDEGAVTLSDGAVVHHARLRRPLVVEQSNLVVHSAGHPGAFFGFAYLPQQIPAGFSPDALR